MDTTNIVKYINKAEKYVYKIRYILEFIFSIIAIFGIYKLITVKHYYGYYHKSYLLISIIYGILVLANIIYNCYKDNKIVEKMFLTFAIPVGIMYLVFMMPAYVPDETSHMWKSYEVSTGNMIPEKKEKGSTLIDVPKELLRYNVGKTSKYIELIGLPSEKTDYQDTEKTDSSAQGYSFILYIASSLGFLISRTFQLNILIGIYLGKIFNFIVFLIGGYYAIKKIPFGKLLILAYLFIPMVMHQAVSFSADCITNISVILFVAYVLSLIFQKEKTTRKQQVLLCALSILVGIVKVVYIPIIGLVLLLIFKKNMTKKEKSIVIPACIILGTIAAIMMYISSVQFTSDGMKMHAEQSNINSSEQIRYIISNPIKATKIIAKDLYYNLEIYINMLIGSNLGWLNIGINRSVIDAFLICVLLAIIVEKNKKVLNKKQKLWMLFLGISTILIIELAMYISWSSVGSTKLEGIQGRYFIPVAILMLLPMCMKNNYVKFKNINVKLPAIVSVLSVFVIQIIYCFFV